MTINHVFVYVTSQRMLAMRTFYKSALRPLGYTEMIRAFEDTLVGLGRDYPYVWLKQLPEGQRPFPTHVAIDAPNNKAVDDFHELTLKAGGKDNGGPGIRKEMSRQPYYAAFTIDPDSNNIEAVCVRK